MNAPVRPGKGRRPDFASDPQSDRILSVVMALATEVSVLRDRLDTVERLAGRHGLFTAADVDDFVVDEEIYAARERRRVEYLDRILWIMREEISQLPAKPVG
jgi:hypothetical protein